MGLGAQGNRTGAWWDLGRGCDRDSGKDHLLSHASPLKSNHDVGLAPEVRVCQTGLHRRLARRNSGQGLWLREPFFQTCEDNGTWDSPPTGPGCLISLACWH